MIASTPLLEQAANFRRDAHARTPGRVADLVDIRVAQLLGTGDAGAALPADLSPAEQTVIDIVEQFLVDVHGLTDAQFATLSEHYTNEEQVAIMFHLALADGFSKLDRVHGAAASTEATS